MSFLDTDAGADWLYEQAEQLIAGHPVKAPRAFGKAVTLVSPQDLQFAVAEHVDDVRPNDREYKVERLLCYVIAQGRSRNAELYDLAAEVFFPAAGKRTGLHDIAERLISPWADEYAIAKADDDAADLAAERCESRRNHAA